MQNFATKAAFCEAVGLQPYALSRLLNGGVAPSVEVCIRIAHGAHLDVRPLLVAAGFHDIPYMLAELMAMEPRKAANGFPNWLTMHELGHLRSRRGITSPELRRTLDLLT